MIYYLASVVVLILFGALFNRIYRYLTKSPVALTPYWFIYLYFIPYLNVMAFLAAFIVGFFLILDNSKCDVPVLLKIKMWYEGNN